MYFFFSNCYIQEFKNDSILRKNQLLFWNQGNFYPGSARLVTTLVLVAAPALHLNALVSGNSNAEANVTLNPSEGWRTGFDSSFKPAYI